MPDTLLPRLETEEARQGVTEAILSLLDNWGLHEEKQAALLGLPSLTDVRESGILPSDPVVLERAGYLLAIGRSLKKLVADRTVADWWISSQCDDFGGFSPLIIMLGGLDGMKRVRDYLESELQEKKDPGDK